MGTMGEVGYHDDGVYTKGLDPLNDVEVRAVNFGEMKEEIPSDRQWR